VLKKNKHFVAALKNNRLVALSLDDKKQGRLKKVSELDLSDKQAVRGWLKGFDEEVHPFSGSLQTKTAARQH
jgi:hypothetical protein